MRLLRRCVARLHEVRVQDRDLVISSAQREHPGAAHVTGYWVPDGTFVVYTEHLVQDVPVPTGTV